MSFYRISLSQLLITALSLALLQGVITISALAYFSQHDLPLVHREPTGKCVKVINYRNGDGYTCNDVDTILRNYKVQIH